MKLSLIAGFITATILAIVLCVLPSHGQDSESASAKPPTLSADARSKFQSLTIRQQQIMLSPEYQAVFRALQAVSTDWQKEEAETLKGMRLDLAKWTIATLPSGEVGIVARPAADAKGGKP